MKALRQVQTLNVLEVALMTSINCTLSSQRKLKHKE